MRTINMRITGAIGFMLLSLALAALTIAATLQRGIFVAGGELWPSLWFRATLLDVYVGLAASYAWIAWKENTLPRCVLWLLVVIGTGNIGVAAYIAWQFARLQPGEDLRVLLTRRATAAGTA